jgi:hypothetical protein
MGTPPSFTEVKFFYRKVIIKIALNFRKVKIFSAAAATATAIPVISNS